MDVRNAGGCAVFGGLLKKGRRDLGPDESRKIE
jgi:hypothetical protein